MNTDQTVFLLLIENVQRKEKNPILDI